MGCQKSDARIADFHSSSFTDLVIIAEGARFFLINYTFSNSRAYGFIRSLMPIN
jgi:hypothetical protein